MAKRGPTKIELFEELAQPNENGESRWVSVDEFVGKYQGLQLLNGAGWSRERIQNWWQKASMRTRMKRGLERNLV